MCAEYLLIDNGSDGKAVEDIAKGLPELDIVTTTTFIIETINTIDACALVVTAENEEVLRVANLKREQEADGLDRLTAAVDVVSEEEIVCFRWEAAVLEETQQVVILAVDITADLDGGV